MSSKSVILLWRYCNFSNFQNGRCRHFWIFEIANFYWLLGQRGSSRINMPYFVKISQSIAKILRFLDFSRWRPPPFWIVEFTKFYWLTVAEGPRRIIVPNNIKIDRSIAEILRFFEF